MEEKNSEKSVLNLPHDLTLVYELHIDPASCKFMYLHVYNMHIFDNGFTPNIVQNIILSFWNNIQYFTSTIHEHVSEKHQN